MSQNPANADITPEAIKDVDHLPERIGEVDEARFKPPADEARAELEQALSKGFPEPEAKINTN